MGNLQHTALAHPKTLIVGLGKTGLSCARYLAARGEQVAITDTRKAPPGLRELREELPNVALFLGGLTAEAFASADQIVVSPGVAVATPEISAAQRRGVPVIGDVELFARAIDGQASRVAAITGSNGKSTVTTLLGLMAQLSGERVAIGGNLGEPALELLSGDADLYVLELSSFQLETLYSLTPDVATVLNVSADHMDRYADIEAYAAAKQRVFRNARVVVINAEDPIASTLVGGESRWRFGLSQPHTEREFGLIDSDSGLWLARGRQALLAVSELRIAGRHNVANALAALAMGTALGLRDEAMCTALKRFPGLPHRTEFVTERDGIRFYNDSKGTNVGACRAALEGLHEESESRTVLIAGGEGKAAEFGDLVDSVRRCARAVVLIGRDAAQIEFALAETVPLVHAGDMPDAVNKAVALARAGDRVLLSPACASFDMYRNYEHRGEVFAQVVRDGWS